MLYDRVFQWSRLNTVGAFRSQPVLGEPRNWCHANSHHVGMLVATEIEVDSTTGMCVKLSMPLTRSASDCRQAGSPLPRRGIDAPTRSETADQTGSAGYQ
jgi:hypothetical protein